MDAEVLRQAVEHAGIAAAGIGFLAGLTFSFNPVAISRRTWGCTCPIGNLLSEVAPELFPGRALAVQ